VTDREDGALLAPGLAWILAVTVRGLSVADEDEGWGTLVETLPKAF
jgi:hypothetical protein